MKNRTFLSVLLAALLIGVGLSACGERMKDFVSSDGRKGELKEFRLPEYLHGKTVIVDVDVSLISPGDVKYICEAVGETTGSQAYHLLRRNSVSAVVYEAEDKYYLPDNLAVTFFYVKDGRLYGLTGEGLEVGWVGDAELLTLLKTKVLMNLRY